jgi:hypothetical protein
MTCIHAMVPDPDNTSERDLRWTQADFEFAASLKNATGVSDAPASLYRSIPWYRSTWTLAAAVLPAALATWAFMSFVYPPALVREALVHEHREATLRGDFQPDKRPMLESMGLRPGTVLPGLMQLQRPCDIDGRTAYHLTTFIEKGGGMVTILAFDKPVPDTRAGQQGSWMGRHWRFADVSPGRTVLLLADNARVLAETERLLKRG